MALKYSAVSAGQGLRVKLPQNHLNRSSSTSVLISLVGKNEPPIKKKMPEIDTLDALEEHEEHDDDYQTITN